MGNSSGPRAWRPSNVLLIKRRKARSMPRENRREAYQERQGAGSRPLSVRSPALESAERRRETGRTPVPGNESRRYAAESSAERPALARKALPRMKKHGL